MFECFVGWGAGGWGLFGGLLGLLAFFGLLAALSVAGVLLYQKYSNRTYAHGHAASANTPELRYARGDLSREEYLRLRAREGRRIEP